MAGVFHPERERDVVEKATYKSRQLFKKIECFLFSETWTSIEAC